jgi:hypothetical protein
MKKLTYVLSFVFLTSEVTNFVFLYFLTRQGNDTHTDIMRLGSTSLPLQQGIIY